MRIQIDHIIRGQIRGNGKYFILTAGAENGYKIFFSSFGKDAVHLRFQFRQRKVFAMEQGISIYRFNLN